MQLNILESKNRLSELVQRARLGEEVVIAHRGVPVVKLVALGAEDVEPGRDVLAWLSHHPLPQAVRRSETLIDQGIAAEREAWD